MKAILKIDNKEIEVEVSKEQIEKLTDKKKNPFARVKKDYTFYFIDATGNVDEDIDCRTPVDNKSFAVANYCTDYDLIQQQAYRETLNRLLWRWQYENDEPCDWENNLCNKWFIGCDYDRNNEIYADYLSVNFKDLNVFFTTREKAEQAIEEVIKPFMAEHPDFVW